LLFGFLLCCKACLLQLRGPAYSFLLCLLPRLLRGLDRPLKFFCVSLRVGFSRSSRRLELRDLAGRLFLRG